MKNRIIKFRVWGKREKAYIQPDSISFEIDYRGILRCSEDSRNYIAQQYTGLKDKNGKEIYEGDILKSKTEYHRNIINDEVVFEDGAFFLKDIMQAISIDDEVIGNIFENPNFLKK